MNEWKNLEIDNLPPDILTRGYEFSNIGADRVIPISEVKDLLAILAIALEKGTIPYDYRKSEPKQPNHEEILQQVKKELNIELDTNMADMKKTIIRHMNDLYDSLNSEAE